MDKLEQLIAVARELSKKGEETHTVIGLFVNPGKKIGYYVVKKTSLSAIKYSFNLEEQYDQTDLLKKIEELQTKDGNKTQ